MSPLLCRLNPPLSVTDSPLIEIGSVLLKIDSLLLKIDSSPLEINPLLQVIDSSLLVVDSSLLVIDSPLLVNKLLLVTKVPFCCETSPALDFSVRGAAHTLRFTVSDQGISGQDLGSCAHTPSLSPHSRRLQMEPL